MKKSLILFFCFLFFLLSCGLGEENSPSKGSKSRAERQEDKRGDLENPTNRDNEIRRLTNRKDRVIEANLESRYNGGSFYDAYDGEECEDSDACMAICDSVLERKYKSKCYNSPRALVENLEDGFFALLNISISDSVDISPGLIAGMMDIHTDLINDLVEEQMSEGDLKSFLAWVATNEDIAEVFLEEDRRSEVMESAFEALGDLQSDSRDNEKTGLNVGLIKDEDSFFHLAAYKVNEAAFQIGYEVLESNCRSRDCKMELLCARKIESSGRSRVFGYEGSLVKCRTSSSQSSRSSRRGRETICYIHGATTWSFLTELVEDNEIKDNDFKDEGNEITVEKCNDHCGDKDSGKCKQVV